MDSRAGPVDTVTMRDRLNTMLDGADLDALCLDHFSSIYSKFSPGMRKDEKTTLLLDYCRRNPDQWNRLESLIQSDVQTRQQHRPSISSQSHTNYGLLLVGGVVGFVMGVLGNLVAAWIQHELLQDVFTPERVVIILGLTIVGLLLAFLIDKRQQNSVGQSTVAAPLDGIELSRTRMWWSRFKSRGRGIRVQDVSAVGSTLDIDTRER